MKKMLVMFLCLAALLTVVVPARVTFGETYTVYYVSTNGSDQNNGSIATPFATLQKAVSAAANQSNAIIKLRGGSYPITSAISLNRNHKGLTIEAYPKEQVTLTGAQKIPFSAFTKVTDQEILDRIIEPEGKEKVVQTYLPDVGITQLGQLQFQGFYVGSSYAPILTWNDTLMQYARYPNEGYLYTDQIIRNGTSGASQYGTCQCEFTIKSDRWKQWSQAKDIWSLGFLRHDWADVTSPSTITENGTLTAYVRPNYPATSNRRIRFFNLLEELDMPGEFYIDRDSKIMYLIPPEGIGRQDSLSYTTYSNRFFNLSNTSGITIRGLRLEGTLGRGIQVSNCTNVAIDSCEITAIGDTAVQFDSCSYSGVKNSYLHELSSRGVLFNNCGDRKTLTKSYCYLTNSVLKTFSQYRRTYAPGVELYGTGITVSHNKFIDSPHFASRYETNECIFEYNEFENICNDTSDAGVLYSGRDWSTRGNIIRYNYFHDLNTISTTTGMKMQAVYLDDMHSSTAVYGNIFYKTSAVALFGGGRYNTFTNNLMLECDLPFRFDSRGTTWASSGEGSEIRNNLRRMPYQTGIWAQTYPELVNILNDNPELPKYNTIRNNVIYKTPAMNIDQNVITYGTVENNITVSSAASFQDYENRDFRLKPGCEILQKIPDWEEIPFDQIGPQPVEPPVSPAPTVTQVEIQGTGISGQPLTISYEYEGYGFEEGNTAFTWYIRENGEYQPVYNHNSPSYTPSVQDRGKQIRVAVTPINGEGVAGEPVKSLPVTCIRPYAGRILTARLTGNLLTVQNSDSREISVTVAQAKYLTDAGIKQMQSVTTQTKTLPAYGFATYEIDPQKTVMIYCSDCLEPIIIP